MIRWLGAMLAVLLLDRCAHEQAVARRGVRSAQCADPTAYEDFRCGEDGSMEPDGAGK